MKEPRCRFGIVWLPDGRLYAVGGANYSREATNTVEMLHCVDWNSEDAPTAEWEYVAPLLQRRENHGVAHFEGSIIAAGGSGTPTVEMLSPTRDQWTTIEPLPNPMKFISLFPMEGGLIGIGKCHTCLRLIIGY